MIGGLAVLGSYALVFVQSPDINQGLWGGVPERLRGVYTTNMLFAAAGFFPFTWLFLFRTDPRERLALASLPHSALHGFYALVLLPSAAWLPLTAAYLRAPSTTLWAAIVAVLVAVAVGATGLLLVALQEARRRGGACWLAPLGAVPFWIQTAVLDATIWTLSFPR